MEHAPRPPQADARSGDRDRDAAAVLEVRNPLPMPPFDGNDFRGWKKQAHATLAHNELWDVVESGVPHSGHTRSVLASLAGGSAADDAISLASSSSAAQPDARLMRKAMHAYVMLLDAIKKNAQAKMHKGSTPAVVQAHAAFSKKSFNGDCFKCGEPGHRASDCNKGDDGQQAKKKRCKYCHYGGHTIEECRKKKAADAAAAGASSAPKAQAGMLARIEPNVQHALAATRDSATQQAQEWVWDTGASSHAATSQVSLRNVSTSDVKIRTADGSLLHATKSGSAVIDAGGKQTVLNGVLTHARLQTNLLSISALCESSEHEVDCVVFRRDNAMALDAEGNVVMTASNRGGIYVLDIESVARRSTPTTRLHTRSVRAQTQQMQPLPTQSCSTHDSGTSRLAASRSCRRRAQCWGSSTTSPTRTASCASRA